MEIAELRPLSLGELLDRAFTLYRANFWVFAGIMAFPAALRVPVTFFLLRFNSTLFANPASPVAPSPQALFGFAGLYFAFRLFPWSYIRWLRPR